VSGGGSYPRHSRWRKGGEKKRGKKFPLLLQKGGTKSNLLLPLPRGRGGEGGGNKKGKVEFVVSTSTRSVFHERGGKWDLPFFAAVTRGKKKKRRGHSCPLILRDRVWGKGKGGEKREYGSNFTMWGKGEGGGGKQDH